jgi:hypothetical protein
MSTNQSTIQHALQVLFTAFDQSEASKKVCKDCLSIFENVEEEFLKRVKAIDELFAKHPELEAIHEFVFDLLLVKLLSAENKTEEFFDSPEWDHIEDKTIDRGTELLNLFLYLSEAKEADVEISLDDFLNEFLLVDEDEFQDELSIYEPFIVNEDILEAELSSIKEIQLAIKDENPIKPLFLALVLFFQEPEGIVDEEAAVLSKFDTAVYETLRGFYRH